MKMANYCLKKHCNFLVFIFVFSNSGLFAQDFEVAPVVMNFSIEPGEMETKKLTIRNHAPRAQAFNFVISDFVMDSLGRKRKTAPNEVNPRTMKDWITINPSFLELNPNQVGEVEVIIRVPRGMYETRWCNISVQVTEEQIAGEVDKALATGVKVVPRISVSVMQSPKSNKNYKAIIESFREVTKEGEKIRSFEVAVRNVGDKVIEAKVHLAVANMETAEEITGKAVQDKIFPETCKKLILKLEKELSPGQYAIAAILDYGKGTALEGAQLLIEQK